MTYVLVVDDSKMFRELIKGMVEKEPSLAVVGEAVNGQDAVLRTQSLKPDVVVMDVRMPVMDGLEAVERIMDLCPTPILICSATLNDQDVDVAMTAMKLGAVDVIEKPAGFSEENLACFRTTLLDKIRLISHLSVLRHRSVPRLTGTKGVKDRVHFQDAVQAVGVGTSTGGPKALSVFLAGLAPSFPACILLVQHLTKGFSEGFVKWLASETPLEVRQATDGARLEKGLILVAPAGCHMVLNRDAVQLVSGEPVNGCCPAVDVLFDSLAKWQEDRAIAVILTGMGRDGAQGALAIKRRNGYVIAQNEETSIIFGMPKAAIELNAVTSVLPIEEIAAALSRRVCERGTI